MTLLESCSTIPYYRTVAGENNIRIPLSKFEKGDVLIVSPKNLSNDIAVFRTGNETFRSLLMRCTHADNPLQFTGDKFRCSLHGSVFNKTGSVEKGPAEKKLTEFKTGISGEWITIQLG
jgi:nitrite reductase/ring-hydroxylating ferredoxin subunit